MPSEEGREEVAVNMGHNYVLQNRLMQCIFDTCSKTEQALRDMLFELLRYGPVLSQNRVLG